MYLFLHNQPTQDFQGTWARRFRQEREGQDGEIDGNRHGSFQVDKQRCVVFQADERVVSRIVWSRNSVPSHNLLMKMLSYFIGFIKA